MVRDPQPLPKAIETPIDRYRSDLARGHLVADAAQERVIQRLDALHHRLIATHPRHRLGSRFLRTVLRPRWPDVQGIYLWGGDGRGKTYLMDCFHDSLPFPETLRVHFHLFMARVHEQLAAHRGRQDPLRQIAQDLAGKTRVLCLDEFLVSDITDAMLLGRLLAHLFAQGITLVTTSNVEPIDLYRGGLQRQQFLPAITLLESRTEVVEIAPGEDFRLRTRTAMRTYHTPADRAGEAALASQFERLCAHHRSKDTYLTVQGRRLRARAIGQQVAWFDFDVLCGSGRSQQDYLELATRFETLLISRIPILDERQEDAARRLIHLVDVAYDHRLALFLTADADAATIYRGKKLAFEFARTASRLQEMGSNAYLAQHRRL
jgi:cell division protein ZapE